MLGLRVHMQEITTEPCENIKAFSIHSFEIHIEKFSILVFSFHMLSEKWCSFNPDMQCGCIYTNIELFIQTNFILHRLPQLIFCALVVPQTQNQWYQCEKSTDSLKLFA